MGFINVRIHRSWWAVNSVGWRRRGSLPQILNFFPRDNCRLKVPQMAYTSLVYFVFKQRSKLKNNIDIILRVLIPRVKKLSKQHYLVMLWKLIFPLCLPKIGFILCTVYRPLVLCKHRRILSEHILFLLIIIISFSQLLLT